MAVLWTSYLFLLIYFLKLSDSHKICPSSCWCNREEVKCLHRGLVEVPGVPNDTRLLDLRFNKIEDLEPDSLAALGNLESLFLNNNDLQELRRDVFTGVSRLAYLYLYKNRIRFVDAHVFDNLPHLVHLYLHSNEIHELHPNLFSNLVRLERLYLHNNAITGIMAGSLDGMGYLQRLRIDGNPLECGCSLLWLIRTMQDKQTLTILGTCHKPNDLAGKNLSTLTSRDFRCKSPRFVTTPRNYWIQSGETNAVFDCVAEGNPKPHIYWLHNNEKILQDKRISIIRNGSIIISPVIASDAGTYTCEAKNIHGNVSYSASLHIYRKSKIVLGPEILTVTEGDEVKLKCKIEAEPRLSINWYKNDSILIPTENLAHNKASNILTIISAELDDAGDYSCLAQNDEGIIKVTFTLNVLKNQPEPPRIIAAPESTEVFKETTVQLPCEAESDFPTTIEWSKDGQIVKPNNRTKITPVGSLVIRNVTLLDAGTYQCKVYNTYGHQSAAAFLKIKENTLPREEYINIALSEAMQDVDSAINKTMESLFNKNKGYIDLHEYFRISRFPNAPARDIARAAEIYERTLLKVRNYVQSGLKKDSVDEFSYENSLSPKHLDLIARLSGCTAHRENTNCSNVSYLKQYRSIDGSCNNFAHPLWGSSLTGFRRILPPIYENGFSEPVGWNKNIKYNGYSLPSARLVSTSLISTVDITEDLTISHMAMQWGQWLDHDLDHALPSVSSQTWDGVDCKKTCDYAPPCFPIDVPDNDPRIKNRRCIDFIRTSSVCGSGYTSVLFGKLQAREQINQLTSFIDASQVYGFDDTVAKDLRDFTNDKGLLRVGSSLTGKKPFLPTTGTNGMDCRRNLTESVRNCFVAGDIRANEQVSLAAMHTIFMREHNRIANKLKGMNPNWNNEKVYQETRKIVGAEMQMITYEHWLPLILGDHGYRRLMNYKGYNSSLDPSISNVFATAALRFGHSLINPILHRLDENFEPISKGHLLLRHAFFSPWRLADEGGVDPLIRGMFVTPAKLKTPTQNLNTELTERLFETAHAVALDLAAINIQRSREHAIPPYTKWRDFCKMTPVREFDDLKYEISNAGVRSKLQELYGSPDNIDVWVGGILEDPLKNAKVGKLFECILVEQFIRLRDGDRFWYENPSTFTSQQLQEIKRTSLARILCDNGDTIDTVSENVFLLPEIQDGLVDCNDIPAMDLSQWIELEEYDNETE